MKSQRNKLLINQSQEKKYQQILKNLTFVFSTFQKQFHSQQDINKCYIQKIQALQDKIKTLKTRLLMPTASMSETLFQNNASILSLKQQNKSKNIKNQKSTKYLNQLKFNDLKQQIQKNAKLLKKVNAITTKSNFKNMTESKLFVNSSFVAKEKQFSPQKIKENLQQKHQTFKLKEQPSLVQIMNSEDEIIRNLCKNMSNQQKIFELSVQKLQNIQIQQMLRKQLISMTLKNQTQIYKMTSNQRNFQLKQIKNRKNIIKFGYTQGMKHLISIKGQRKQLKMV